MALKEDIIDVLEPIFGIEVKNIIIKYFDEGSPQEMIDLVSKMLKDYLGEKNAEKIVNDILSKYPSIAVNVD